MERELNEDITAAIRVTLVTLLNELWFQLYLRNLDFNGEEVIHLTDDDVINQAEMWEKKAREMLEQTQDDWTKEMLQKTIELVPKVFTGMFGYVAAEEWKDFCESSREMAKTIRLLFNRYGLVLKRY